jgi:periplasmic divalent cation tolerance protein
MTDKIVVFSTCGSEEEAVRIARTVIEAQLAACVNIVPAIRSIYRWQDSIQDEQEWLLVMKTKRDLFTALSARLQTVHSYEVPEAIALPIVDGLPDYLAWIDRESLQSPAVP